MPKAKHRKETVAYARELEELLAKISSDQKLLRDFLDDLLSPVEREEIAMRWQIVKKLIKDIPQRDIMDELGVAAGTVTRGARMLLNPDGGFRRVLQKIKK